MFITHHTHYYYHSLTLSLSCFLARPPFESHFAVSLRLFNVCAAVREQYVGKLKYLFTARKATERAEKLLIFIKCSSTQRRAKEKEAAMMAKSQYVRQQIQSEDAILVAFARLMKVQTHFNTRNMSRHHRPFGHSHCYLHVPFFVTFSLSLSFICYCAEKFKLHK